jgi:hypothetical protein
LGKWSGIYESSLDTSYNEFCQPFGVRYSVDLVENNSSGTKTKGLRLRLDAFSSPHSSAPVTEEDRVACVAHLRQFISGNSQYHWHTDNLRAFLEFEGTVEFAEDSSDVFLSKLDESVCEGSCMGTAARFEIASTGSLRYNGPNFFPSDKGAVTVHLNKDKAVSP